MEQERLAQAVAPLYTEYLDPQRAEIDPVKTHYDNAILRYTPDTKFEIIYL